MTRNKRIRFGSTLTNLHAVNQFIEDICDHYNIFNSYFGHILTAVNEAVQNAIMHGNHNDPDKYVEIQFEQRPDGLCFVIKDEGNGFNPNEYPDPTDITNDGKIGRGLFLMQSLSDELNISDGGSTIELFFNITGIDQDLAANRAAKVNSYFRTTHTVKDQKLPGKG
jgi:serine/threonine-protein kinase RsbW